MERFNSARLKLWRLSRWQAGLLVAMVIAIGIAVAIVAGVAVLILTPIFLLAAVALKYLVRPPKAANEIVPPDRPADPKVVEFDRKRRSG
jgi:hypothetical protein